MFETFIRFGEGLLHFKPSQIRQASSSGNQIFIGFASDFVKSGFVSDSVKYINRKTVTLSITVSDSVRDRFEGDRVNRS